MTIVTRCHKNPNNQEKSSKTADSKALLQAIKASPVSSKRSVSCEYRFSHSSAVRHLYILDKIIRSCRIVPHVTKMMQNFWLMLVF